MDNTQEDLKKAENNFNDTLMVSISFPVKVTDLGESSEEDRFIAEAVGVQGMVTSGRTRDHALNELHMNLVVKLHYDHGMKDTLMQRGPEYPPTGEQMMHLIESMLFDYHCVGGLMPTTISKAKQTILRAGGPQGWSPQSLGFDPTTNFEQ